LAEKHCQDQALIDRHVELDPLQPAVYEARLIESSVPIWALAGHFGQGATVDDLVFLYQLPREPVEAALSFYRCHREALDARVAENHRISPDEATINEYIELNPDRPALYEARLKEEKVPVWALIGYYLGGATAKEVAEDYDLPLDVVEAAIAYYECHSEAIEARINANHSVRA